MIEWHQAKSSSSVSGIDLFVTKFWDNLFGYAHTLPWLQGRSATEVFWLLVIAILVAVLFVGILGKKLWHRRQLLHRSEPVHPANNFAGTALRCHWQSRRARPETSLQQWVCLECGIEAFTHDGLPPKECKRDLAGTAL